MDHCVKYHPHPSYPWKVTVQNNFFLCVNCDLDLSSMTLSQGHNTIVWNIIQIQHNSKEWRVWHGFWLSGYCDLDFADITLGQGYDTPLGHEQ